MSAAGPSHQFQEHTGEVRLEVRAPTREELFAEAGRALAELMLGDAPQGDEAPVGRPVEVSAPDPGALLAEWLNELVFLSEVSKQVFTRFRVDQVDAASARGEVWGVSPAALKTAVKAATLHGVAVEPVPGGFVGRVVLDV